MWRVIFLLVGVLALDVLLFYFMGAITLEMNMPEIMHATEAREMTFSRETQKAVDDAWIHAETQKLPWKLGFSAAMIRATTGGFFVAGRWFERHRRKVAPIPSADAAAHT